MARSGMEWFGKGGVRPGSQCCGGQRFGDVRYGAVSATSLCPVM